MGAGAGGAGTSGAGRHGRRECRQGGEVMGSLASRRKGAAAACKEYRQRAWLWWREVAPPLVAKPMVAVRLCQSSLALAAPSTLPPQPKGNGACARAPVEDLHPPPPRCSRPSPALPPSPPRPITVVSHDDGLVKGDDKQHHPHGERKCKPELHGVPVRRVQQRAHGRRDKVADGHDDPGRVDVLNLLAVRDPVADLRARAACTTAASQRDAEGGRGGGRRAGGRVPQAGGERGVGRWL